MTGVVIPTGRVGMAILRRQEREAQAHVELDEQAIDEAELIAASLVDEAKVQIDRERMRESER